MQTLNMLSQVVSMNLEELAIIGTTLTSIVASTTYLATKHFTEKKHRTRRKSPMGKGQEFTGWFQIYQVDQTILNFSFTRLDWRFKGLEEPIYQPGNHYQIYSRRELNLTKGSKTSKGKGKVPFTRKVGTFLIGSSPGTFNKGLTWV